MSRKPSDAHDPTVTLLRGQIPNRPLGAVVRVTGAKAKPPLLLLDKHICTVGSSASCDLVVADPAVSRRHLTLTAVAEGVDVTDLGSHNGTYHLGSRVQRVTVALGSTIRIGATTLTLDAHTDALAGLTLTEPSFRGLLGNSLGMRQLFAKLARLEGSLVPILVTGESGVGKELVARAIHDGSRGHADPFVAINCAAIPRDLVASELFGHRRGAFTGATEARKGAFDAAHGGTLFLDEIGELPLDLQPVILRALETSEVRPVGADSPHRVSVRIVSATNRDLAAETRARRFREDLYFRLAAVSLHVPPLRDRREDIPMLAASFARAAGAAELASDVLAPLEAHDWPGNVRELKSAVLTYLALGELPTITTTHRARLENALQDVIDVSKPYSEQKELVAERFTKVYLEALMLHTSFNQTAAAKLAGLDRSHLGKMLARHGLSRR